MLVCEICGGTLCMNSGGNGATCSVCGMNYTVQRLREMLDEAKSKEDPIEKTVKEDPVVIPERKKTATVPAEFDGVSVTPSKFPPIVRPEQFRANLTIKTEKKLFGKKHTATARIVQGGIGLGDKFYFDDDTYFPQVYGGEFFNGEGYTTCVKEGMYGTLVKEWADYAGTLGAKTIMGVSDPKVNAYNYSGTVIQYFGAAICYEFPDYEVYADVREKDGRRRADYMLCKDGQPMAAVYLYDSHDSSDTGKSKRAMKLYKKDGIPAVHFFTDYRNDIDYVKERIENALNSLV